MPLDPQGDLEKEFVQAALARSKYLRQGDATKAGREREKLRAIAARIRALEDRGLAVLRRIAGSQDAELRLLAAAGLLEIDKAFAVAVLQKVRQGRDESKAFDAEMILKEWDLGMKPEFWA